MNGIKIQCKTTILNKSMPTLAKIMENITKCKLLINVDTWWAQFSKWILSCRTIKLRFRRANYRISNSTFNGRCNNVDIVRLACRKSLTFCLIKYVCKCWLLRCQLIWLSLESRSSMWFGIRLCSEWPVAINNAKNYGNRIFGCVYVGKPQFWKIHIKSAVTNRFAASHIRSSYK